jgi:hypothetical protein
VSRTAPSEAQHFFQSARDLHNFLTSTVCLSAATTLELPHPPPSVELSDTRFASIVIFYQSTFWDCGVLLSELVSSDDTSRCNTSRILTQTERGGYDASYSYKPVIPHSIYTLYVPTRYRLNGQGNESRWKARFSTPVPTGSEAHPASYTMGTGSFPGVKRPGRGVDHPSHLVPR